MAKRGTSFKGASDYLLHDKGKASTSERVAWFESINLWADRPEHVWHEMWDTWRERANLKREAGLKATGRDNKAPVLHLSLSWHPDEQPTPEHMKEAARSALKALGLQEHQVLLVAHKDEPQQHVHLLINTVHPHTGKTVDLKYSKEALSRWAEAYEREHGSIRCEERVKNNARREELRQDRQSTRQQQDFAKAAGMRPPPDKPYEPVKDRSPPRGTWLDRQEIIDRMKALRAELGSIHNDDQDALWQKHKSERDALEMALHKRLHTVHDNMEAHYKPQWRELYRRQAAEKRNLRQAASHSERLLKRLDASQERERRSLGTLRKKHQKVEMERVWAAHRERWHQLKERHSGERAALRDHHAAERAGVTFAKAREDILSDRNARRFGRAQWADLLRANTEREAAIDRMRARERPTTERAASSFAPATGTAESNRERLGRVYDRLKAAAARRAEAQRLCAQTLRMARAERMASVGQTARQPKPANAFTKATDSRNARAERTASDSRPPRQSKLANDFTNTSDPRDARAEWVARLRQVDLPHVQREKREQRQQRHDVSSGHRDNASTGRAVPTPEKKAERRRREIEEMQKQWGPGGGRQR